MLAILDPELRHSSPSRRQSAALIGSLALISIGVGAALRRGVRRSATATVAAPPVKDADLAQPRHVGTSDSPEVMGGDSKTVTKTSERISAKISEEVTNAVTSAINVGVATATASAITTASSLRQMLAKDDTQNGGKDDERPILLAKILATEPAANLRRIAAWGLAEHTHKQVAAEALATALRRDSDASVREMAAWALADANRSSTAVDALAAALRGDANARVVRYRHGRSATSAAGRRRWRMRFPPLSRMQASMCGSARRGPGQRGSQTGATCSDSVAARSPAPRCASWLRGRSTR